MLKIVIFLPSLPHHHHPTLRVVIHNFSDNWLSGVLFHLNVYSQEYTRSSGNLRLNKARLSLHEEQCSECVGSLCLVFGLDPIIVGSLKWGKAEHIPISWIDSGVPCVACVSSVFHVKGWTELRQAQQACLASSRLCLKCVPSQMLLQKTLWTYTLIAFVFENRNNTLLDFFLK